MTDHDGVELTPEQQKQIRDHLYEAQVAILRAIVRQAELADGERPPKYLGRLTRAFSSLQGGGWFMYAPGEPRRMYNFDEDNDS